jgi:hypothetical protein
MPAQLARCGEIALPPGRELYAACGNYSTHKDAGQVVASIKRAKTKVNGLTDH